jgi:hypothetical protein
MKNKPITIWYFLDTPRVRYTTDGSMPLKTSRLFTTDNVLTSPAKVTIRRVSFRSVDDETFSGTFVAGDYLAQGERDLNMKSGGFNYAYYEGGAKLPDFKKLKPVKIGRTDSGLDIPEPLTSCSGAALQVDPKHFDQVN